MAMKLFCGQTEVGDGGDFTKVFNLPVNQDNKVINLLAPQIVPTPPKELN